MRVTGGTLEARHLDAGADAVLFLFNHGRAAAHADVWLRRSAGNHAVTDIVTGREMPARRDGGGISVAVELQPGGVQVLHVARPE